jgi:phosphoribosylamine--glycine ligase
MNVLLVGRGGREHAIAWALARSPSLGRLWVAPGNGGTAAMGGKVENAALPEDDGTGLIALARTEGVSLAVIGPEAPLAAGLADAFRAAGIACFGPSQAAARLESSKAFAKDFMIRHAIPTARYAVFRQLTPALKHLRALDYPVVIKASGLAAGKGVVLPETQADAETALRQMLVARSFGAAGDEVLIEERIEGPEASVLAFCDGVRTAIMPVAQDHKRAFDGDKGPNTGGMGAYAPAPIVTHALLAEIRRTILDPAVRGIAAEGAPFVGVLYAGLMLTKAGPRVIEFNCRFGDPETQVVLPLLDGDLAAILADCARGSLDPAAVKWRQGSAVAVVAASGGYPGDFAKGRAIAGLSQAGGRPDILVFQAGTKENGSGGTLTDGGRVLSVTGLGATVAEARARAYAGIETISFAGMHYRRDIGAKA